MDRTSRTMFFSGTYICLHGTSSLSYSPPAAPLLFLHLINTWWAVCPPNQVKLEDAMQHVAQCFPETVFSHRCCKALHSVATTITMYVCRLQSGHFCMHGANRVVCFWIQPLHSDEVWHFRKQGTVPAPIATLRNLNIVQNGKSSKPSFWGGFCRSQDLRALNLLVFAGGPAFFHFGPLELFRALCFWKNKSPTFSQETYNECSVAQHHLCWIKRSTTSYLIWC